MLTKNSSKTTIAYEWLSYGLLIAFVYYWLFTLGYVFFSKKTNNALPRQYAVYKTFFRQHWALFAKTKVCNIELMMVIRDKTNPQQQDSIKLIRELIINKKKYAPFNNYYDAIDHLTQWDILKQDWDLERKRKVLEKQYSGKPGSFYLQRSFVMLKNDSSSRSTFQNLVNYAKYTLRQNGTDTVNKEFCLIQYNVYIKPALPKHPDAGEPNKETTLISSFSSF